MLSVCRSNKSHRQKATNVSIIAMSEDFKQHCSPFWGFKPGALYERPYRPMQARHKPLHSALHRYPECLDGDTGVKHPHMQTFAH